MHQHKQNRKVGNPLLRHDVVTCHHITDNANMKNFEPFLPKLAGHVQEKDYTTNQYRSPLNNTQMTIIFKYGRSGWILQTQTKEHGDSRRPQASCKLLFLVQSNKLAGCRFSNHIRQPIKPNPRSVRYDLLYFVMASSTIRPMLQWWPDTGTSKSSTETHREYHVATITIIIILR